MTWWWPCGMESKDRNSLMCVCAYIFELYMCVLYCSSPYLLVFGDDCVLRYTQTDDVVGGFGEV